jgi:predicted nucleotidyltransferase
MSMQIATNNQPHTELSEEILSAIVSSITAVAPTEKIYLFGSYATGCASKNSDIDLYVVLSDNDKHKEYSRVWDIGYSLYWLSQQGYAKDIVASKKRAFAEHAKRIGTLEHAVAEEGVKLYG